MAIARPDRDYVEALDRLIPEACREADKVIRKTGVRYEERVGVDGHRYNYCWWTRHFHNAMNRLAAAEGLRKLPVR